MGAESSAQLARLVQEQRGLPEMPRPDRFQDARLADLAEASKGANDAPLALLGNLVQSARKKGLPEPPSSLRPTPGSRDSSSAVSGRMWWRSRRRARPGARRASLRRAEELDQRGAPLVPDVQHVG